MCSGLHKQNSASLLRSNVESVSQFQLVTALLFPFFTIIALGIDSVAFQNLYFNGRQLTNLLSISYFLIMLYAAGSQLRKLMLVMVVLSYIGELLFCKVFGMYSYKTSSIPLYVPFGHAIVYASGYIISYTAYVTIKVSIFKKIFAVSFALLFLAVAIFLNDLFSLIFGVMFFLLLKRKQWQNLYYFIALCVIFIELVGTYFRCWAWEPKIFGVLPAANPPMGAVFFYAGGDVLLAKIVTLYNNKKITL